MDQMCGNGLSMWEMALRCGKRLKYMGNDLDMLKMTQICGQ